MSVSPVLFNAEMFRQSQPWKSAWRISLERDMAARGVRADQVGRKQIESVAKVTPRAEGYLVGAHAAGRSDGWNGRRPGRPRLDVSRPRLADGRRDRRRPQQMCDQACGSQVRGEGNTTCWKCKERRNTPRPDCVNRCGGKVNKTNPHGMCKVCWQAWRYLDAKGPRPVCSFRDATHCCAELVYRGSRTGLCGFHRKSRKGRYRTESPRMVAHG